MQFGLFQGRVWSNCGYFVQGRYGAGWKTGRTEELQYLPTCSSWCASLSWPPWLACPLLVSMFSPLCCSESKDSSDLNSCIYSSNSLCSVSSFFMTLSGPIYFTLSLTVFKCTTCQPSKPHQRNRFFSRGHDPYTHACKARPPSTDVGLL